MPVLRYTMPWGANGVTASWTRQFNDLNRDGIVAWIRIPDYAPNT